jgi:hypothetical protein
MKEGRKVSDKYFENLTLTIPARKTILGNIIAEAPTMPAAYSGIKLLFVLESGENVAVTAVLDTSPPIKPVNRTPFSPAIFVKE